MNGISSAELTRHGENLLEQGNARGAARVAQRVILNDPELSRARLLLARALIAQGCPDQAWEPAAESARLDPHDPWCLITLSEVYRLLEDQPQAVAAADAAIQLAPSLGESHYTRAIAFLTAGRPDPGAALPSILEASQLDPGNADVLTVLGFCHDELGEKKKARQAYNQALALDPAHACTLNNLAALEISRGRLRSAATYLTAVLAQAPDLTLLHKNFDLALLRILQRFWWLISVVAVVEGILLAAKTSWTIRASIGLLALAFTSALARYVLRTLPQGASTVLHGLWKRSMAGMRWYLFLWVGSLAAALVMALAPVTVAGEAGVLMLLLLKVSGPIALIVLARRVGQRTGKMTRHTRNRLAGRLPGF
ncbi:tetratricopeptide repeat protein [Austwickia chelonae]|uniref:tetratricopeptide repeat protein n=1 Tax=Austwickia chelonae TaxID=100225 RepID=UPI000E25B77F|nr:tetratricopeptide repeat protein [Austwickia chelonae]